MSKIEKEELANLTAAVRGGVGLAGFHGGMCDAFRDASTTSSCAAASGSPIPATSSTTGSTSRKPDDPIMAGIDELRLPLRAVLHARRPFERSAGDDDLLRRARAVDRGRRDAGGLEAAATARAASSIPRSAMSRPSSVPQMSAIVRRGMLWAAADARAA